MAARASRMKSRTTGVSRRYSSSMAGRTLARLGRPPDPSEYG
jgi:hypothetical protein